MKAVDQCLFVIARAFSPVPCGDADEEADHGREEKQPLEIFRVRHKNVERFCNDDENHAYCAPYLPTRHDPPPSGTCVMNKLEAYHVVWGVGTRRLF